MSPVASSASTVTPAGRAMSVARPPDEGVVEADPFGAAVDRHRRLGALEHDVLEVQGDAEPVAERLVAQADREERLPPGEQAVDRGADPPHLRVVVVAGVAGAGAHDHQVEVVQRPVDVRPRGGPPRWSGPARRARAAACSRSRPRRRGSPPACRPAGGPAGRRPGRSARSGSAGALRRPRATRTSSSAVSSTRSTSGTGAGGTRPKALRIPPALACVSATSCAASESRTRVAPAVTLSRPARSTSAVRMTIGLSTTGSPVGVPAEHRQRGAVVAAALALVLLDQPAGVLDRAAGDGRGVHRVAQHLADVTGGAAGEEVLGVDQVRHRLQERPEHLAALVADVAHHLELLVDDHEELVDLLLVARGSPAAAASGSARRRRRPRTRKVPLIGFIRTSPPCTLTCRSGLAPIR